MAERRYACPPPPQSRCESFNRRTFLSLPSLGGRGGIISGQLLCRAAVIFPNGTTGSFREICGLVGSPANHTRTSSSTFLHPRPSYQPRKLCSIQVSIGRSNFLQFSFVRSILLFGPTIAWVANRIRLVLQHQPTLFMCSLIHFTEQRPQSEMQFR
jgi:hypothetical protein